MIIEATVVGSERKYDEHETIQIIDDDKICLDDPMNDIKQKYEYNYRFLLVLTVISVMMVLLDSNNYFYQHLNETAQDIVQFIIITTCVILISLCIFIIIYGHFKTQSLHIYVNNLLNVRQSAILYNVKHEYYGLFILSCLMCMCFTILFFEIFYHKILVSDGCNDPSNASKLGVCIVYYSKIDSGNFVGPAMTGMVFLFQSVHQNAVKRIDEQSKRFQHTKIYIRIQNKLNEWQNTKNVKQRKAEIVMVYIISFIFWGSQTIIRAYANPNGYHDIKIIQILISIISLSISAFMFSYALFALNTLVKHFQFPYIIMYELSISIRSKNINDIIEWWELRNFYINCIINIYTASLRVIVLTALIGSTVLSIFSISKAGLKSIASITIAVTAIVYAFVYVASAVSYYESQLLHANTLNKEKLQYAYNNNKIDAIYDDIVDKIICEVKENSVPIRVLDIKMDPNFMLFLRASAGTLFIAFLAQ